MRADELMDAGDMEGRGGGQGMNLLTDLLTNCPALRPMWRNKSGRRVLQFTGFPDALASEITP